MSPLTVLAILLAALAGAFVLFVLVPKGLLVALRDSLEARVKHRYPESPLVFAEYTANSFGIESRGALQWRGNGALVMTESELCFFQVLLEGELVIPLEHITKLRLVHKHLGKTTTSSLLRIEFRGEQRADAVAFWVPKPDVLKGLLEARLPPPGG
jgi:hypothetical protein